MLHEWRRGPPKVFCFSLFNSWNVKSLRGLLVSYTALLPQCSLWLIAYFSLSWKKAEKWAKQCEEACGDDADTLFEGIADALSARGGIGIARGERRTLAGRKSSWDSWNAVSDLEEGDSGGQDEPIDYGPWAENMGKWLKRCVSCAFYIRFGPHGALLCVCSEPGLDGSGDDDDGVWDYPGVGFVPPPGKRRALRIGCIGENFQDVEVAPRVPNN